jgi:hypothetical protein
VWKLKEYGLAADHHKGLFLRNCRGGAQYVLHLGPFHDERRALRSSWLRSCWLIKIDIGDTRRSAAARSPGEQTSRSIASTPSPIRRFHSSQ